MIRWPPRALSCSLRLTSHMCLRVCEERTWSGHVREIYSPAGAAGRLLVDTDAASEEVLSARAVLRSDEANKQSPTSNNKANNNNNNNNRALIRWPHPTLVRPSLSFSLPLLLSAIRIISISSQFNASWRAAVSLSNWRVASLGTPAMFRNAARQTIRTCERKQ